MSVISTRIHCVTSHESIQHSPTLRIPSIPEMRFKSPAVLCGENNMLDAFSGGPSSTLGRVIYPLATTTNVLHRVMTLRTYHHISWSCAVTQCGRSPEGNRRQLCRHATMLTPGGAEDNSDSPHGSAQPLLTTKLDIVGLIRLSEKPNVDTLTAYRKS